MAWTFRAPSSRLGFKPLWFQNTGPPKVTYGLLIAIGVVFVLELIVDLVLGPGAVTYYFAIDADWPQRPWSVITSIFAHAGFPHIFFNGLFLYFFGPSIETIVGRSRFLVLWFVAGILSGLGQAHLPVALSNLTGEPFGGGPSLGASGALMALLGVSLILLPKTKLIVFPIPVPIPLWVGGIFFALMDILGLFNPDSHIGNAAHLVGLAIGLGYGLYVDRQIKGAGLKLVYS